MGFIKKLMSNLEQRMKCSALKDKLNKLKSLDKEYSTFGSDSHEYEFNAPLSEEQIREFENRYRVTIPAEYRQFLQTVGDGGAGPFYGLFKLDCNDGVTLDAAKPFEYAFCKISIQSRRP